MSDMGINNVPLEPDEPRPGSIESMVRVGEPTFQEMLRDSVRDQQRIKQRVLDLLAKTNKATDWHDWQPKKDDEP